MSWKDLIFVNDDKKEQPKKEKEYTTKFPDSNNVFKKFPENDSVATATFNNSTLSCEPYMEKVMDMYQKGFDSLNQDGYDFYEFYKAVLQVGADKPETYKMAFTMAQSMGAKISKNSLIEQAQYYTSKLVEVHSQYKTTGEQKKSSLIQDKETEKSSLTGQLNSLEKEIEALKVKQYSVREKLSGLDENYRKELEELECKTQANDVAKDNLLATIDLVVNGIKSNI